MMLLREGVHVAGPLPPAIVHAAATALGQLLRKLLADGTRVRSIHNGAGYHKSRARWQVKLRASELRSRRLHVRELLNAAALELVCLCPPVAQRLLRCIRALDPTHRRDLTYLDCLEVHVLFNRYDRCCLAYGCVVIDAVI